MKRHTRQHRELGAADPRDLNVQIHPIDERTGQTPRVTVLLGRGAVAGAPPIAAVTARAGIHRGDHHAAGGKRDRSVDARDRDLAFLDRLPQRLEHVASELGQLVEEEHAQVREAHLSSPRDRAAPHQRLQAHRVMRRPKRSSGDERVAGRQLPADAVDAGHLDGLVVRQWREDRGKPTRQHRLARPRRSDHQHVVVANDTVEGP